MLAVCSLGESACPCVPLTGSAPLLSENVLHSLSSEITCPITRPQLVHTSTP